MKQLIKILLILVIALAGFTWSLPAFASSSTTIQLTTKKMKTKKCSKCKETKLTMHFYKCVSRASGVRSYCIKCTNKSGIDYSKTKQGVINKIYYNQTLSTKRKGSNFGIYNRQDFSSFALASDKFNELFEQWVMSGHQKMLRPSFDRDNDYLGYSFDNFRRWCTWQENFDRGCADRKNGINNKMSKAIIGTHKITGEIIKFHSQHEASRRTGIQTQNIGKCCLGERKSAGGYKWRFANE